MKSLFHLLFFVSLASSQLAFAADAPAGAVNTTDSGTAEQSRALSAAKSLCPEYFAKRYQAIGEEIKSSLHFEKPTKVKGWPGRWRMRGVATLRHYKNPKVDTSLATREEAIRNNKSLSATQIRSQIEALYFLRSEIVEFEVEVTTQEDSPSEIDVTLR